MIGFPGFPVMVINKSYVLSFLPLEILHVTCTIF